MHIENLKRGDWILVTQFRNFELDEVGPQYEQQGIPLRVRAISAPFVMVSRHNNPRVFTIDIRLWAITKASPSYVKEWRSINIDDESQLKAVPMEGRCRVFYCPVCSDGQFNLVANPNEGSYFRCTQCGCVVVEGAQA